MRILISAKKVGSFLIFEQFWRFKRVFAAEFITFGFLTFILELYMIRGMNGGDNNKTSRYSTNSRLCF